MSRRYNWHDETPAKNTLFVVSSGEPPGPSSVVPMGKTWGMRVRGAGGTVTHSYRCPVHGVFDAVVPRDVAPDWVLCPTSVEAPWNPGDPRENEECGLGASWAGSSCGIGWAAGEVTS